MNGNNLSVDAAAELVIVECGATGASGRPLWEYLPGMFVASVFPETDSRYRDSGRIVAVNVSSRGVVQLGICTVNGDLVLVRASWMRPDFADELTVQALYLLVRRAYLAEGYSLELRDQPDRTVHLRITDTSNVINNKRLRADDGPAYAVFARALAKAPTRNVF